MRTWVLSALLFFYLANQSANVFSQDSASSPFSLAEKVYLQLDNKVYTTNQTIWFKAIVVNAAYHTPTQLSGVLYAELIDASENIVERKLIKIEQGTGEGFFQLSSAYRYGIYQIRAYTEWDKNFGSDFLYKEYILISGAEKKETPFDPIKTLTVIEGQGNERRLNVQVDPTLSDSISGRSMRFVVTASGNKDTLSLKRNRNNQYLLDYLVPAGCDLLTLQVEMDNAVHYAKTIVIDTNYIDLQFFPESGELVQGLPALLGFKVLDYEGRGRKIQGEIINAKGATISHFETNKLGMGLVRLGVADSSAKYTAKITSGAGLPKTYPLPDVVAKGNTLSVRRKDDNIIVTAGSNYLGGDSITVRASCRGMVYFDFRSRLKNGAFEFKIDRQLLPEGIIDFTLLLSPLMTPAAERLYFNERPEERLRISIASNKNEYVQREKTEITITTQDAVGQPVPASISFLAFNELPQGKSTDLRQNILSYFLLSSDLKGKIENPGYYFAPGTNRFDDLDVLLLTQGWRKYHYSRDAVAFRYSPESNLTLSGEVKGGLSDNKLMKGAELTMMVFSKPPVFSTGKTDSLGRFHWLMDDIYGDNPDVLIQSANKSNKKRQYLVTLDKKDPPPVIFEHAQTVQKPDSVAQAYIKQSIESKKAEDAYRALKEGHVLEEVVVKTRSLSPLQKEVTDKYGEAKVVISGKDIQAKEEKWSYGLYSVLLFQFPDKVRVTRYGNGFLYASLYNSEPTLVVIDGIPVKGYDYSLIPNIPPSEVKSFELIPYAKNFYGLFCEAISCGINTPSVGNVIAIYTHAGIGLYGARATIGMSKMVVPVFSERREFYAPEYEKLTPDDWQKPDLRNLLHWNARLTTDTTGRLLVPFYNSDNTGSVRVIVEAISKDGEIGYGEMDYGVSHRKQD